MTGRRRGGEKGLGWGTLAAAVVSSMMTREIQGRVASEKIKKLAHEPGATAAAFPLPSFSALWDSVIRQRRRRFCSSPSPLSLTSERESRRRRELVAYLGVRGLN